MTRPKIRSTALVFLILLGLLPLLLLAFFIRQGVKPKAETKPITIEFSPRLVNKNMGETFTLSVYGQTPEAFSAVNLILSFDPEIIMPTQISPNTDQFSDDLSPTLDKNPAGKLGLTLVARKPDETLPAGRIRLADVTFQAKNGGTTTIGVDSESQIIGPAEESFTAFDPTVSQNSVVTIMLGSGDTPKVAFTMRFNGITTQNAPQTVRLRVQDVVSGTFWDFPVRVVSDSQGTYSTQDWVTLSGVTARKPYAMFIKGQKHLQRRMEVRRTLQVGDNNENSFDWTQKPLLPGDLPNPTQTYAQDGVANALDASLILERLYKSNADSTIVADLNFDGIVNLNDYALFLATLSSKNDDEQ